MSTARRAVIPAEGAAPPPAGRYSAAIVAGGLVWVAGQTPRLPSGERIGDAPFAEQARQTLANVDAVARAAGSALSEAVQVTVYLSDVADRFEFDDVWSEFVTEPFPARAVVQSDLPGFALEVVAVCALRPADGSGEQDSDQNDDD